MNVTQHVKIKLSTEDLHYAVVWLGTTRGEKHRPLKDGDRVLALFETKKQAEAFHQDQCPNAGIIVERDYEELEL